MTTIITADGIQGAGSGLVPIGTIASWHKTLTGTPAIPFGWVQCDGQTLSDADSVYDGEVIPDLNGGARFLRGSATSGIMQAEDFLAHNGHGISTNLSAGDSGADYWSVRGTGSATVIHGGAETRPINMGVVWIMRVK